MYALSVLRGHLALVGFALLAGSIALAGCGSATAPGSGSPGTAAAHASPVGGAAPSAAASSATGSSKAAANQPELCADIGQISRLVILRSPGASRIQELHFPFPVQVTVTSAAAARSVARALCALPRMPRGIFSCPMQLGGTSYRLTFMARGRQLAAVTAVATGCQTVTGVGPVRRALDTSGFWSVLGRAMGLFAPRVPVFRGDGPATAQCRMAETRLRMISGCPAELQPGSGFRK
jgi:hypothetical protein